MKPSSRRGSRGQLEPKLDDEGNTKKTVQKKLGYYIFFWMVLDSEAPTDYSLALSVGLAYETNEGSISTTVFGFIIRGPTPFSRIRGSCLFMMMDVMSTWMCDLEGPTLVFHRVCAL